MQDDCATQRMRFETQTALALEAAFDGGRITSDGGLLWLSEVDSELGLCQAISEDVPEWRKRRGRHSLESLVRQRVFQIACGYEDQDDADFLRKDPLLKLSCGSLPQSGADLASQPTLSRLENAASRRSCHRIAETLFSISILGNAPREVLRPRCFGTSTLPQIPPTVSKKGATTMVTTNSTSTTRFWSSTARAGT